MEPEVEEELGVEEELEVEEELGEEKELEVEVEPKMEEETRREHEAEMEEERRWQRERRKTCSAKIWCRGLVIGLCFLSHLLSLCLFLTAMGIIPAPWHLKHFNIKQRLAVISGRPFSANNQTDSF